MSDEQEQPPLPEDLKDHRLHYEPGNGFCMREDGIAVITTTSVHVNRGVISVGIREEAAQGLPRGECYGLTLEEALGLIDQLNVAIAEATNDQNKIATEHHNTEMQRKLSTAG